MTGKEGRTEKTGEDESLRTQKETQGRIRSKRETDVLGEGGRLLL